MENTEKYEEIGKAHLCKKQLTTCAHLCGTRMYLKVIDRLIL